MIQIHHSHVISADLKKTFDYFCNPDNVSDLLAGDIDVEVKKGAKNMAEDSEYSFNMTRFGLSQDIRLRVREIKNQSVLSYSQTEGLFKSWIHKQVFESEGINKTRVTDIINYELPLGFLGLLANDLFVRRDMSRIFENRLKRAEKHFS